MKMPSRIDVACPLCGGTVNVGVHVESRLTHSGGNGTKGFLTAEIRVGGMEHTCSQLASEAADVIAATGA